MAAAIATMAATNKCLAQSNKSSTGGNATKRGSPQGREVRVSSNGKHLDAHRARGDAKTLFHALDLLEHLMPIAPGRVDAFMAFCAELETEGDGWKARLPCWHGWSRAA